MKRFIFGILLVTAIAAAVFTLWLRSGGGGIVNLSEEELAAARNSGAGAETMVIAMADAEAPLPTVGELMLIVDRAELEVIAERIATKRAETEGDERAKMTVLAAEVERLRGNTDAALILGAEGALALPSNSRARFVYAKTIFADIVSKSEDGSTGAMMKQLSALKKYRAEVKAAVDLDPTNVDAIVSRVLLLAYLPFPIGSKSKAAVMIESIGEYDPLRRDYWRGQMMLLNKKEKSGALEYFREIDKLYPGDLDIAIQIGELLLEREDWRGAADAYDKVITDPMTRQGYRALYHGAKARELGGFELEAALEMLVKFEAANPVGEAQLMPRADHVSFHRGRVLELLGRKDEALAAFGAAQQMKPNNKRYEEARERLMGAPGKGADGAGDPGK